MTDGWFTGDQPAEYVLTFGSDRETDGIFLFTDPLAHAVFVGGLPGFTLDVRVAPTWTHACPYSGGVPTVPLIVSGGPDNGLDWGVGGKGRMRIFVLDAGAGRPLWIDVEAGDGPTFDKLVRQATPSI